ncbi:hypothetical protein O181_102723 [Austropuccinia psidii MF-1]|uniref:Uncharacterized protein n=1 Tax=Austropuccinia psidii MF-1 TaxID=1389203 RepID=A0A9Q3JJ01_9BASI|nr:hypothetical protein [Austropuccinia psidii MF-1]
MSELNQSTCILSPLSPTNYSTHFKPRRSALNSSTNTRQRDDYELNSNSCLSNQSPQLLVTPSDDEQDLNELLHLSRVERFTDGYPASELPFASEPALEGELEQELPPLKKLKSEIHLFQTSSCFDPSTTTSLVVIQSVKSILTRRDDSNRKSSPSSIINHQLVDSFNPWTCSTSNSLGSKSLSVSDHSSRPISRRSSSDISSIGTGTSLKSVRFASGNGFINSWGRHNLNQNNQECLDESESPVATVMYLTHSADAYDRSPIIVEDGLRLPPRAKKDHDDGNWLECQQIIKPSLEKIKSKNSKKSLNKIDLEILKSKSQTSPLNSSSTITQAFTPPNTPSTLQEENSIVINTTPVTTPPKSYREIKEEDEEEEDVGLAPSLNANEEEEEEEEEEKDNVDASDDDDEILEGRGLGDNLKWGLGKWSQGEVFGNCDVLGGF